MGLNVKKKLLNATAKFFKIFIIAILAILLFFSWQLYRNGINLSFVTAIAERALNPDDSEYTISLGNVQFSFVHRAVPIALKVYDVSVFDKSGHKAASIEELTTYLSAKAILNGTIAPSEIVLYNPQINMFADKNGGIGIGFGELDAEDKIFKLDNIASAVSELDNVQMLYNVLDFDETSFGRYSYLTNLKIVDGSLFFREDSTRTFWFFPRINVNMERRENNIAIDGSLNLLQQKKSMARIEVRAAAEKSKMKAKAYVMNFSLPARVADVILAEARVDMPLNGEISLVLDLDKEKPVNSILLRLDNLNFSFSGDKGNLILPSPISASYDVKSFRIEGYAEKGLQNVKLSKITAKAETGAYGWGDADIFNLDKVIKGDVSEKLIMDFRLHAKDVTVDALKNYWPAAIGPMTYEWIKSNVYSGVIDDSSFNLVFVKDGQKSIEPVKTDGEVIVRDVSVRYLDTLPIVQNAKGKINITKDNVRIIAENGESLGLRLYFADLFFYDIWEVQEKAKMLIKVNGSLSDAISLLDKPPFGFITGLGLNTDGFDGTFDTVLDLDFPLRKDLNAKMVKVNVKADVKANKIDVIKGYPPLLNSEASIDVDNENMSLKGSGVLSDAKVNFSWIENFNEAKEQSLLKAEMMLDVEARKRLGLDIYPFDAENLKGLVKANLIYKTDDDKNETINVNVDLTSAEISNSFIGLEKKRNIPAFAEVLIQRHDGLVTGIKNFYLNVADRVHIRGSADFDEKGSLSHIYFDEVKLQGTDLKAEASDVDGIWKVRAWGKSFNAESLIRDLLDGQDGQNLNKPFKISLKLDEMWLSEKGNVQNVDLNLSLDKNKQIYGLVTADATTGEKFKITIGKTLNGKTKIVVESDNAGAFLNAFDLSSNIRKGALRGYAYMDKDFNFEGKILMKDFTLVKAETLSQVLKIASLTGILGLLQGEGLDFDMALIPFSYSNKTLSIEDAHASGFSLGITAEGYLKNEYVNMEGTIVPAYAVNSFFGKLPLIGHLFTSEDGGGLISFKYYVEGETQKPKITVNPLSALTPGMVRKVFDKNVLEEVAE